jgi:hypothetical protein
VVALLRTACSQHIQLCFSSNRLQCLLHSHHSGGKKGCIQSSNYIREISAQSVDAVFRMCRCGTRGSTRPMLSISQFQGLLPGTLQPLTNCASSHCKIPKWPVTRCPSSSLRSTSLNLSRSVLGSARMPWSNCGSFLGTSTKHCTKTAFERPSHPMTSLPTATLPKKGAQGTPTGGTPWGCKHHA